MAMLPGRESPVEHVGVVKWFNVQKGYGFIQPVDGGGDLFVHINELVRTDELREGERVNFRVGEHAGRRCAKHVKRAEEAHHG